jgi:hypothetical protein
MTMLLQRAIEEARKLPEAEQDAIASIILEELADRLADKVQTENRAPSYKRSRNGKAGTTPESRISSD